MSLPFSISTEKMEYFDSLESEVKLLAWARLHESIIENGEIEDNKDADQTYEDAAKEFWETWLEVIDLETLEDSLIDSLDVLPSYREIFHSFHVYNERDPEAILEERKASSEKSQHYQDVFRQAMEGNDTPLEEYYGMSPGTLKARGDGKRIAKKVGSCYVCGTEVQLGRGELLLEHEVPPQYRHLGSKGSTAVWFTRCYDGPCADPSLGRRIFDVGHRVQRVTPNKLPDKCFVCSDEVAEGEGFLVHYTLVPPKLRKKMPWKNAKRKKYYVVCNKTEPDIWSR